MKFIINERCFIDQLLKYLLISAVLSITIGLGEAFNLENRLPIIKYGEPSSYFGYSVSTHVIDDADNTKWLLVGAPLGQNLQPQTNRSGALFKCPITQLTGDCEQVITDGRRSVDGDDLAVPTPDEIKDGQWMGVTVQSQGPKGNVLVCAHRYILKVGNESQYGQGLCYVLSNSLEYDETYEPCKGRSTARAHEEYGYCQVGTSGTLLEDGTMILGTPGPYTWRGTVFVISATGEYLRRDKNHYYGPHMDKDSPVDKYSYLGMSVTGGKYFQTNQVSYVAGAPRSNGHGQVVFFGKNKNSNPLIVELTLDGEQFASSFGYTMASADVNGDNQLDLLVAAPFYFSRHEGGAVYVYQNENYKIPKKHTLKLTGKLESRFGLSIANIGDINKDTCEDIAIGAPYEEKGVVYIYLGSQNGLSKEPSQIIRASDLGLLEGFQIKTFGSSLSGGIDIDNNSYPDLLIGAYDSSAAIVLLSRPITNIKTEVQSEELKNIDPSKIGCAKDLASNLTCFSIKACCAIEPYETSFSKYLDLIYTIEAETFNNLKKYSRVFFGPDFKKRSNVVKRSIRVKTDSNMECHEEIVYVKENTRDIQSPIKFRLNYTIIEPSLPDSGLKSLQPILDQTQADRQFDASFQKDCGSDDICESQLEVKAEMSLEMEKEGQYTFILGQSDEIQLNVSVSNENDSAYEAQLFVVHQPSVAYIGATKGSVICNRFNNTVVACTLGNPLRRDAVAHTTLRFDPSGLEDSEPKLSFNIFANSTSKQITPLENVVLNTNVVKKAELKIVGWAKPEQTFYGGENKGESAMVYFDDVGTVVEHTYQIYNDGPWRAPYLEVDILWPQQVENDKEKGKWLLYLEDVPIVDGTGECILKDPINPLKLKKRVENLMMAPAMASDTYTRRFVNKSHLYSTEYSDKQSSSSTIRKSSPDSSLNRVKRDRAMVIRPESLIDSDGKKTNIVYMDCSKNTAKCIKINCKIYNLQRKTEAYIHVRARMWNSTLVMDYPRVDLVRIVSIAKITIPGMYNIQQNTQDDSVRISTHAYPELLDQTSDASVPLWIIIVAIISGLILLALVIFILWKLGFFKRRRPDPTLSGNLEKNSESKPFIAK